MRAYRGVSAGTIFLLIGSVALSADDTCKGQSGDADCVAGELGSYRYIVTNGTQSLSGVDEAATINAFRQLIVTSYNTCTISLTDNRPPWSSPPAGNGYAQQGNASSAMWQGIGQFWSQAWTLSADTQTQTIPLVLRATYPNSGSPACNQGMGPIGVSVTRQREVLCPAPYWPSFSGVPNAYCYRTPPARVPGKNFGQCGGGQPRNPFTPTPTNPATGNKVQPEVDYIGHGEMPLKFERIYNSLLYTDAFSPPASNARGYWSRLGPNWRSTYDRFIRLSENVAITTAYAYRQDGQTLHFRRSGGLFIADDDVADTLVKMVDGSGNLTGWKYTIAASQDVETYDASGRLISLANRAGVAQTLAYDAAGRLQTVTDAFGRTLTFTYDSNSSLATMTDPAGQVYSYTYNASNNVTSVTYPDSQTKTYLYNETAHISNTNQPNALTGIVDENSSRFTTYKYNSSLKVLSTERAGQTLKYSFSYSGLNTTITDPLGTANTQSFTNLHGMAKISTMSQPCTSGCGSAGSTASTTYDVNGNVASRTDFRGNKSCHVYDLSRNLETYRLEGLASSLSCPTTLSSYTPTTGTRERKIATQWHSTFRLPTQIDEAGKRTTFTYDSNGRTLTRTELDTTLSLSRTWTYTYNSFGQMLTANGPRTDVSDVTTYMYYSCNTGYQCGQVATVTNAAGHVTTYNTYNAHGQPLTITDPNGLVMTLTYDLRQHLTSRTVGTEVTSFTYWPTGLLKKTTLPDSSYLEYTYDAAHRLTEIEDSEGNRVVYTLDNMGNRTAEQTYDPSNALTQTRTRAFDTLNRLWKEIGAANTAAVTTTYGYDNNGNQTSIAAPMSRTTGQAYDELNRLTQTTDPLSGVTAYGYNALDQLISVTDPRNKVTSYTYNALGDLTQQVSPDTGTTTNTYNAGGNLATSTDARNKTATYSYDALNRVTGISYPDQTITYAYDAGTNQKGRLTSVADNSGSTTWTYDAQGRITSKQQSMGVTKTVGYSYDSYGRPLTLTLPSGNIITYGYTDGKVTSLTLNGSTTILSNMLYQPFGPTRGWTWGNSTQSIRQYDQDGKIESIDSAGLKTYSYDNAFRITGITDAGDSALSQNYGYDPLDRLTSATGTALNQSWTYDANGNRLTQGGGASSTYTVSSISNRLTSVSGALSRSYTYDNAGNTTADGSAAFVYNDAGRMTSATKAAVTTTYATNALGQRVKKTASLVSRYFVYDEAGHLIGEYDNFGALIQETIWLADTPVATIRPNGASIAVFYIHSDHLNTPRRISQQSDNVVVWRWNGDPFGTTAVNQDPDGDATTFVFSLRFPGQYFDAETGLNYNYYRDGYDAFTGRYTQSDPIGLGGGLNTYLYVLANPVSLIDSLGLTALDFDVRSGTLTVDPEVSGRTPYKIDATSGRGKCENKPECEKRANEGPIPRGGYYIDPSQIDNPSLMDDLRRNFRTPRSAGGGDWGDWRVRIYPNPGTQRFGRTGFYLHGGYFDGSAGCIDIGGGIFGDDRLLEDLQRDPDKRIPLRVH